MEYQKRYDLQHIDFTPEFFQDEVREGFYIPSVMKRYWAAQLTVLAEIDKICKKYDIPWFADCGTLLGGVRHGGFIPWDDDMDICMLRHDYIRFFTVAKEELPPKYCVLDVHTNEEYSQMIGRIVNEHAICWGQEHLKRFHGCPYTVGVDIFPLDGISKDEEAEEKRRKSLQKIMDATALVRAGKINSRQGIDLLADIEKENSYTFRSEDTLLRELILLGDYVRSLYPSEDADNLVLMPLWITDHNHVYSKKLFENAIMLPFENTYLPVSARYDEILKIEYGNYMNVVWSAGIHDYPVFKEQEEIYKRKSGNNLLRYTLEREQLEGAKKRKSLKEQCFDMLHVLSEAHVQVRDFAVLQQFETASVLLKGCQMMAVSLQTLFETHYEGCGLAVRQLKDYYEMAHALAREWDEAGGQSLDMLLDSMKKDFEHLCNMRKKQALFLPCKAEWWDTMSGAWEAVCQKSDWEVLVMPLPYFEKDMEDESIENHYHCDCFPEEVPVISYEDYDIEKKHPDEIIIQFPYDDSNDSIRIPDAYYSKNLIKNTDKLIYIPCFDMDDPKTETDKASEIIKYFIEQPGVLYADEIRLKSQMMKQLYLNALMNMVGEDTRDYWDEKIIVCEQKNKTVKDTEDFPEEWKKVIGERKTLLYQIHLPFLLEHRLKAIKKIKDTFNIIEGGNGIACIFSPHESLKEIEMDLELSREYAEILTLVKKKNNFILDLQGEAEKYLTSYAGYYGNEGWLAHRCVQAGVPVMIMGQVG